MDVRSYFAEYVRHRLTVVDDNLRAFQAVLPDLLSNQVLRKRYLREVIEPTFRLAEPMFQQWMEAGVIRHVNVALTMRAIAFVDLGNDGAADDGGHRSSAVVGGAARADNQHDL